jgi:hypothetical protein
MRDKISIKSLLANVRLTGVMQKSSQIAQSLSELMKVEQFQSVSEEFSKELIKVKIPNSHPHAMVSFRWVLLVK